MRAARSPVTKRLTTNILSPVSLCARGRVSDTVKRNFSYSTQHIRSTPTRARQLRYLFFGSTATALGLGYAFYDLYFQAEDNKESSYSTETETQPTAAEETKKESTQTKSRVSQHQEYKYVLIGGGTASYYALQEIKKLDPEATVLIIAKENEPPYQRPPLSKELWNSNTEEALAHQFINWQGKKDSVHYPKDEKLYKNVTIQYGRSAIDMDVKSKLILLDDRTIVEYGKVLIATGGEPRSLPIDLGDAKDDVSTFRTIQDFDRLYQLSKQGKRIVIVGGGFLGSELAAALGKKAQEYGGKITQVFPENGCLGLILPPSLAKVTTEKIRGVGVDVRPGILVKGITKDANGLTLTTSTGETLEADHVVVCVGLKPNTDLNKSGELEIDPENGGIVVNSQLEALRDVFAAGDVSSYYDFTLEKRRRVEHYEHAASTGAAAGRNMVGPVKPFEHLSMFWSDLPDISFQATGIIDAKLDAVSVFDKSAKEKYGRGVIYYFDKKNHRLVGVLLWNIFDRLDDAKELLKEGKTKPEKNAQLAEWIPFTQKKKGGH